MELFVNKRYNIILHTVRKRSRRAMALCTAAFFLAVGIISCKDDVLLPDETNPGVAQDAIAIQPLPGIFGVDLGLSTTSNTKADNVFSDGDAKEYDLATPDPSSNEYYHYLLLYKSTTSYPLIFPIDISGYKYETTGSTNNVTATITNVFKNGFYGELNGNTSGEGFTSNSALASYLSGMKAYVLLNFKLDETNHSLAGAPIEGDNTVAKLANLKQSQLEEIEMYDYKIRATKSVTTGSGTTTTETDFFIMSNSVYSDGSNRIVDGTFTAANIFPTEEQAKLYPALAVYAERLASKVTVTFDLEKLKAADFDPYGKQYIQDVVATDLTKGLPEFQLTVQKVNMDNGTGIRFNDQGYEILSDDKDATLTITGFGLSNLERNTHLYKDINPLMTQSPWQWTYPTYHRSYWARDYHYEVEKTDDHTGLFTKTKGYPHQFRLALDTDSVTSYHLGLTEGYNDYNAPLYDEYTIGDTDYKSYKKLGTINTGATIDGAYLRYRSFEDLARSYDGAFSKTTVNGKATYGFSPLYALENTYYDPGMLNTSNWVWEWQREPYATATNLIVMAQIVIHDNTGTGGIGNAEEGEMPGFTRADNTTGVATSEVRDLYLGQNNIFYLRKVNFLKSKLEIFNSVMLSGGNAGIQILHGLWDQHKRWEEGDENQNSGEAHLDKVAWNEGSVLWFAEVETEIKNGKENPKYDTTYDDKGNPVYHIILKDDGIHKVFINNDTGTSDDAVQYLDLIPAEISGGDGQRLIAPHQNYMGMKWRYYLAPEATGSTTEKPIMDEANAVEISYNHLVALFHKIIGPVDVYKEGKMYFSVPIPHNVSAFGVGRNVNVWKNLGSFSLVRNNWYNISVDEITRLGTPVDDPSQPIIPVMDVKRSYINMGVELLNWHEIVQDNIPMM